MPVKIPENLPASEILQQENIFVMDEKRAYHQDIRPLKILILNLMPTKAVTETQLLRLIGNTPIQVDVVLIHPKTHQSKNTSREYLATFYKTFDEIKDQRFDGMIVTGAPIEHLEFEEVHYWEELQRILNWKWDHVTSTLHICWGAQAGLYHHYGIPKFPLEEKLFGVFPHKVCVPNTKLLRGFDDIFWVPHSRYAENRTEDILKVNDLEILSVSDEAGVYIVATRDGRQVFVSGHSEYDRLTLKEEYERDLKRGYSLALPKNYFPDNNPKKQPINYWRAHAHLLFANWLNYFVYQETPYEWVEVEEKEEELKR